MLKKPKTLAKKGIGGIFTLVLIGALYFYSSNVKIHATDFLPSDLNKDSIVDAKDIDLIKQHYTNTAGGILNPSPYDLNNDHKINSLDLAIVEDNQGNGTDPRRDWDKDGFSVEKKDCDDRNATIHPFAAEKSNGKDDNCNGTVDDLVDYAPRASAEFYEMNMHFVKGGQPEVTVQSIATGTYATSRVGFRSTGSYQFNVYDANNKIIDVVAFSVPKEKMVYNTYGHTRTPVESADFQVKIPKIAEAKKITLRNDQGVESDVNTGNATSIAPSTTKTAEEDDGVCPSEYQGDATGAYAIERCYGFKQYTAAVNTFSAFWEYARKNLPELVYFPPKVVKIVSAEELAEYCGTQFAGACYQPYYAPLWPNNDTIFLNGSFPTPVPSIAHEFSHKMDYVIRDHSHWYNFGSDPLFESFVRMLSSRYCQANDPKCALDPSELAHAWDTRPLGPCDEFALGCNYDQNPAWNEQYEIDPLTGGVDMTSARPNFPGTVRVYGVFATYERWATLYEAIFVEDRYPEMGLISLVGKDSKYIPNTAHLTMDVKILGENALIKDVDHDGVPDKYDNCSPQVYPTKCPIPADPNAENACSNADQIDTNNNGQGDKCEFLDGKFFACGSGVDSGIVFYQRPIIPSARECAGVGFPCGGDPVFVSSGTSDEDRVKFTHPPNCGMRIPYCDFSISNPDAQCIYKSYP